MSITYKAILKGDRLEWSDDAPKIPADQAVMVQVTISESTLLQEDQVPRGQRMSAALERIAAQGGISSIDDPSAWQREVRQDRQLPGRDE